MSVNVTIQTITYDSEADTLLIIATSTLQPDVSLTAEGYGGLAWKSWLDFYRTTFYDVTTQPDNVNVTSSIGGSDVEEIPYP